MEEERVCETPPASAEMPKQEVTDLPESRKALPVQSQTQGKTRVHPIAERALEDWVPLRELA